MSEGQGFARKITLENIKSFAALLRQKVERSRRKSTVGESSTTSVETDPELSQAEALFTGNSIRLSAPKIVRSVTRNTNITDDLEIDVEPDLNVSEEESLQKEIRGPLLWRKENLPKSDVQRQHGAPTGGLRLTQAKFEVNGQTINQTTYFRQDLFGHLSWETNHPGFQKGREAVPISFDVKILGISYGRRRLMVSHKPSGEAGQGNYTTMLHWGELSNTIYNLNLVGKTFHLYGCEEDTELFFIEID